MSELSTDYPLPYGCLISGRGGETEDRGGRQDRLSNRQVGMGPDGKAPREGAACRYGGSTR